MNRKFEDKLAELAFGDLSPAEAARLEQAASGNPEAQRTLSMYRDMKVGLKGLAEVPEDQFSKERLRDAILTQGLKPVAPRPVSNRAWLWMPCAALIIGFGYTLVKHDFLHSTATPEIVMGPALKGTPLTAPADPIKVAEVTPPVSTNPLAPRGMFNDRHAERNSDEAPSNLMAHDLSGEDPGYFDGSTDDSTDGAATVQQPAPGSRLVRPKAVVNTSAARSGPVVLIDQNKDQQTGAECATEVSSASNVLVGG